VFDVLAMINTDMGNLGSVARAFAHVGAAVTVTDTADDLERAGALILPGVGAFGDGMATLHAKGLVVAIRKAVLDRGVPLLGICLGMQLLADAGEEFGRHTGLGLVPGCVVELKPAVPEGRVPNMGWCPVHISVPGQGLFRTLGAEESFYFAHSFHLVCAEPADVAAVMPWGDGKVVAAVRRGNVHGVQFHPEKSQDAGLDVLHAFWMAVKERMEG
jgi:glutamine amidotransferase